jgi:hypothetical protein
LVIDALIKLKQFCIDFPILAEHRVLREALNRAPRLTSHIFGTV